jgi:hypothetical protein
MVPVLILVLVFSWFWPGDAWAVTKTWDAGCGANTNWSCAANWSDDVVPLSGDTVNFSSGSTNSVVDASFAGTITNITINGYTGTISLARSLTVSTAFSQSTGTFTAGSQSLSVNSFTLGASANFTASSGTTSIGGNTSINSGTTFNANGGTVDFTGSTTTNTIACGNKTFNLVTYTKTAAGQTTIASDCNLPLGNNPTIGAAGLFTLNGTLTGTGTLSRTSTLTLGTTGVLSGFTGLSASGILTISGSYDFSNYTTFTQSTSTFTLSTGASFTAPTGTASFGGTSFTIQTGSTFNANGGTINFNGTGATLSCNNVTFNLVTLTSGTNTKTIGSNCNLPLGANPTISRIILNGTLSGSGTLTTANTIQLNAGGALSGFTGLVMNPSSLTVAGAYNFSSYTTFSVAGSFTLDTGGVFTAPAGVTSIGGGFTVTPGTTFNANGGTVDFTGNGGALSCANITFNLVTLTSGNNSRTIGSNCNLPLGANPTVSRFVLDGTLTGTGTLTTPYNVQLRTGGALSGFTGFAMTAGNLTLTSGSYNFGNYTTFSIAGSFTMEAASTFTAPSGTASFSSTFTINGGTFNANGGTVNFTDSGGSITCNNATFNFVTLTNTSTKTVNSGCNLPLGNNPTIGAGITLYGTLSGSGLMNKLGAFTIWPGGALSGFSGMNITGSFNLNGSIDFSNYTQLAMVVVNLNSGSSFTAPSGTMSIAGALTIDAAANFNANGGTLIINPTITSAVALVCNNAVFNLVKIQKGPNSGTLSVANGCNLPLGNNPTITGSSNLTIAGTLSGSGTLTTASTFGLIRLDPGSGLPFSGFSGLDLRALVITNINFNASNYSPFIVHGNLVLNAGGTLTAPTGTLTVGGNFSMDTGSTFNANGGTVLLNGTNQPIGGGSNITFNNLTKISTAADTLTFKAGTTTTVMGTLTLQGVDGGLLTVSSDTAGTPWNLNAQGATNISYVSVSDSNNISDSIGICNSVDGGGNTGWIFNPASCNPSHGTAADATISNYQFVQAASLAAEQAAQDQNGDVMGAWLNGLPFGASQFANSFPAGRPIISGVANFAGAVAVASIGMALAGIGISRFWAYSHKRDRG